MNWNEGSTNRCGSELDCKCFEKNAKMYNAKHLKLQKSCLMWEISYQLGSLSTGNPIVNSESSLPLHDAADEDPIATVV